MRCLNPECGSNAADEVNISVNVSYTEHDKPEPEWEGETYMGDCSEGIGTECRDCQKTTFVPGFREIIVAALKKNGVPW